MAIVTGTITAVHSFSRAHGQDPTGTIGAVENNLEFCICEVTWPTGTYAQADDATFTPGTAIQTSKRDGKTVTVVRACPVAYGDENGTITFASDCTVAAGVVACTLVAEDGTTEHANAAMSATWNRPISFVVGYYQAA